ncbi:hypothetical protein PR048_011033, partial [Dryococelus australis]
MIPNTRQKHQFVPFDCNRLKYYTITSSSQDFQENKDYSACISGVGKGTLCPFFYSAGPSASFQRSVKDTVWVPFENILCVINPAEFSTSSVRKWNVEPGLSNELAELSQ